MEDNSRGYVSVIGGNLIQPILDLVQSLESKSIVEPNEVQTGQEENGFSCAIVTLSVFLLESAFNRTKYVRNENDDKSDIVQYFFKFFDEANLTSNLDEIIALPSLGSERLLGWHSFSKIQGTSKTHRSVRQQTSAQSNGY